MSKWFSGLNDEQKQAVACIHGPLLVLAGAGSGKTRVITHRIAYMLDQGIPSSKIVAVTFTNKAAAEMKQRLLAMVGQKAHQIHMSTFHSLGLRMLREMNKRDGRTNPFTIFDAADQQACLREIIRYAKLPRSIDLPAILSRISLYKNNFIKPSDFQEAKDEYDLAAQELYPRYLESMRSFAAYDFDDLVTAPTTKLENSSEEKAYWHSRFSYFLVDEYQDTNGSQLRFLKALVNKDLNVCVVGDDDQSIYGWRGAQVKNILSFEKDFKNSKRIYLMKNYRSVGNILTVANKVIEKNTNRFPKKMEAVREMGRLATMVIAPDEESEFRWVAENIKHHIVEKRKPLREIAILYRSNTIARELETELRRENIEYQVIGGTSFFDHKEVKDLCAYLRVCQNPNDEISLRRIINYPARGIGPKTIEKISIYAQQNKCSMWKAIGNASHYLESKDRSLQPLVAFRELIQKHQQTLRTSSKLSSHVSQLIADVGLHEDIEKSTASMSPKAYEQRWGNVKQFLEGLSQYEKKEPEPSLSGYLSILALQSNEDVTQEEEQPETITLSTLHGSKGLEWSLVYFVGLEDGILPHERVIQPHITDAIYTDIDEERRLCYVGITRAKDQLYLSRSATRIVRGKEQPRVASRFLDAIPEELLATEDLTAPPSADERAAIMADLASKLGW